MRLPLFLASALFCVGAYAQVSVINGASFRPEQPVAPGSYVSGFGLFTGAVVTNASVSTVPKTLGGVTVTVDGIAAPLVYVSPTQINFIMPYATATGLRPIEVTTPQTTLTGTVRVMSASPGIFTKDIPANQPQKGAILNSDYVENTSGTPTHRGDFIQIYATGPGALKVAVNDGDPAPSDPAALAFTKSDPQVFIGGVLAEVLYSGLAPGYAGLWQLNVVVPDLPFIKGRVAAQVFIDNVDSNEVGLFVAE